MKLNVFKNRSLGFYCGACVALLSIVTAIVYAACYHNLPRFMSWEAFYVVLAGSVVALVGLLFNNKIVEDVACAVLILANVIGLCFFIQYIYNYVVVVMVGIDLNHFDTEFIVCTALFAVSLIAAIVSFFMPKAKENK